VRQTQGQTVIDDLSESSSSERVETRRTGNDALGLLHKSVG